MIFVKCLKQTALLASLVLTAPAWSQAAPPPTPTSVAGAKIITVEEGGTLAEGKSALFYDTRTVLNFGKGHVPGAREQPRGIGRSRMASTASTGGAQQNAELVVKVNAAAAALKGLASGLAHTVDAFRLDDAPEALLALAPRRALPQPRA